MTTIFVRNNGSDKFSDGLDGTVYHFEPGKEVEIPEIKWDLKYNECISYAFHDRIIDEKNFETLPSNIHKLVVLKFNTSEQMNNFKNHPSFQGADFLDAGTLTFQNKYKTALKSEDAKIYQFQKNQHLNIESWKATHDTMPSDALYIEISSFKPKHQLQLFRFCRPKY